MTKTKTTTRKLEETSWLAQIIKDKMEVESNTNGITSRWHCLHTLLIVVREADNEDNHNIYYSNYNGKRSIVICEIPAMILENGSDFGIEGMQNKLRGLAERYKNDDGEYIVSVLTTHDLNSCIIKDIEELMYQMSTH
jgi:hypothetical protein